MYRRGMFSLQGLRYARFMNTFLPISSKDMQQRGWDYVDFAYVIGDAYVDHPSFGPAIISRLLEAKGFRVGIISQPDWRNPKSITIFGKPRLGFLVSSGNMDSMVNHYTVNKKRRSQDAYSPGGKVGLRPDHACVVYGNLIRQTYKDVPLIMGGVEASLRRMAHYDYWDDKFKRSILMDSGANIISYGMGEHSIVAIAEALDAGLPVDQLTFIPGTVYRCRNLNHLPEDAIKLPCFEEMQTDKLMYARSFNIQYQNFNHARGKILIEEYPHDVFVVQNPPSAPLSTEEMDAVYRLPYTRNYHPIYKKAGGVPAIKEVKFSITSVRGCLGECSFCSLAFHQGRIIQARSHESILAEAREMTKDPNFKGYIHDVGGPTANFRVQACEKQSKHGACTHKRCLFPKPCKNLRVSHSDYIDLLRKLRKIEGVKKVFIRSGIRFDYVMADKDKTFLKELVKYHISGQLRVAPEHICNCVLDVMGKPHADVYKEFITEFNKLNKQMGKKQFTVPYLMSSHPGSGLNEAIELAEYIRDMGFNPEQVQDFYPTPSTMSTCMFYTGVDPRTMKSVYVPKSTQEKNMQRALIHFRNPKNRKLVIRALKQAGRTDLIGANKKCLVHLQSTSDKQNAKHKRGNNKPRT